MSLSVGSARLLENANARLVAPARVALVGDNGSGKSTLLKAVANEGGFGGRQYFSVTSGRILMRLKGGERQRRHDAKIIHVGQDELDWEALLLLDEMLPTDDGTTTLEDVLELSECSGSTEAMDAVDAWRTLLRRAEKNNVGWSMATYSNTPLRDLSPGCAKRAYLAIALLRPGVDLLLLDEPTNHLDLPSIAWLQNALITCRKSVIVVSHDVEFLDAVADHVWEIDAVERGLTTSGATYSAFRQARQVAREQQQAAYEAQVEKHAKVAKAAQKLKAASIKGSNFTGKDKDKLQRDFKRDRAGRSGAKAKAMEGILSEPKLDPVAERRPFRFMLEPLGTGSDSTILLNEVVLGYETSTPLPQPPISLRIDMGDRVAIVGLNGVGKSTLLSTLTRDIEPLAGEVHVGRTLRLGNLMQVHESLPRAQKARAYMAKLLGASAFDAGQELIRHGLTLRQVDCPIGELNPGARVRLLLASFAARSVNALVLDEPSNHLDEDALREVKESLCAYPGMLILVSHDRSLLRALEVHRVFLLSKEGLEEVNCLEEYIQSVFEPFVGDAAKFA